MALNISGFAFLATDHFNAAKKSAVDKFNTKSRWIAYVLMHIKVTPIDNAFS